MYLALLLYQALLSNLVTFLLDKKPMSFRLENPTDHRILKLRFYPTAFCDIGLHKKTDAFIGSKSKNMKLGIR